MAKYKGIVRMKREWFDYWPRKPTKNNVLEALADAILHTDISEVFEVIIEKVDEGKGEGFRRKDSGNP